MNKVKVIGSRKCGDTEFLVVRIKSENKANIVFICDEECRYEYFEEYPEDLKKLGFSEELISEYRNYKNCVIATIQDISQALVRDLEGTVSFSKMNSAFDYVIEDVLNEGIREIITLATINDDKSIDLLIKPEDLYVLYFNSGVEFGANIVGNYVNSKMLKSIDDVISKTDELKSSLEELGSLL